MLCKCICVCIHIIIYDIIDLFIFTLNILLHIYITTILCFYVVVYYTPLHPKICVHTQAYTLQKIKVNDKLAKQGESGHWLQQSWG